MRDKFLIAGKAKKIKKDFYRILSNNPDVEAIILLSYEGLVIVSTINTGKRETEDVISAIASGINYSIRHFLKEIKWRPFSRIIIEGSNKDILVKDIKRVALLVMLTKSGVDRIKIKESLDKAVSMVESLNEIDKN